MELHRVYDGERPGKKLKYTLPDNFEFFCQKSFTKKVTLKSKKLKNVAINFVFLVKTTEIISCIT